jgi:hypothetical protein
MNEIPEFHFAVSNFHRFLEEHGHSEPLVWVFRDDLWFRKPDHVLVCFPPTTESNLLAKRVYDEGRVRGLVSIEAIAVAGRHIIASVWFPKFPEESVQGWSRGLKLSLRQPLPVAKIVSGRLWRVVRHLSGYRRYQRNEPFIGTRVWAAN